MQSSKELAAVLLKGLQEQGYAVPQSDDATDLSSVLIDDHFDLYALADFVQGTTKSVVK